MQIRLFSAYKKWKDEDSNLGRESNNKIEPKGSLCKWEEPCEHF